MCLFFSFTIFSIYSFQYFYIYCRGVDGKVKAHDEVRNSSQLDWLLNNLINSRSLNFRIIIYLGAMVYTDKYTAQRTNIFTLLHIE